MNIGINARYVQHRRKNGIAIYLLNLILNLQMIDRKNKYILFFGNDKFIPDFSLNPRFQCDIPKISANNLYQKMAWEHLYLPYAIKKNRIDIFHEPCFVAPLYPGCRKVITVHDIAYLFFPSHFTCRTRIYLKTLVPISMKQSELIIAVSENTKNDIMNNFPIPAEKIKVIYEGVDEIFKPLFDNERIKEIKNKYGIKKNFILTVSLISPRKNIPRLIKAFKMLKEKRKIEYQLIIVGERGWLYEEVFKEVAMSGAENDIIFCGQVPKADLHLLYNAAALFVYPSLYEGFGLPLLEAMACGCPIASSKTSSIPEICGDAALLFNPTKIEDIAESMYTLITNKSLRDDLIKKGFQRVKKFSWQKTAQETLSAYAQVYENINRKIH